MMNPISFDEQNVELSPPAGIEANEIGSLPVFRDGEQCVSLWTMSWRERLSALVFGRVWLQVLSGPTQPPVALSAKRTIFVEVEDEAEDI